MILVGTGVDRLPALASGGALLRCQDQVVVFQEPLDPGIAKDHQPMRCGSQLDGDALEIRSHSGQRSRWGRRLRLSIKVLVQGRDPGSNPVQVG